jgi:Na+/proline symporter
VDTTSSAILLAYAALLAWTVAPRIWRATRDHDLYTVGDYPEFRYSRRVRALASVPLRAGSLSILAGQFMAVAWILDVTLGLGKPAGCVLAAGVTTGYFAAGGLHSGTAEAVTLQCGAWGASPSLLGMAAGALATIVAVIPERREES